MTAQRIENRMIYLHFPVVIISLMYLSISMYTCIYITLFINF
jgi:hypothetical protein